MSAADDIVYCSSTGHNARNSLNTPVIKEFDDMTALSKNTGEESCALFENPNEVTLGLTLIPMLKYIVKDSRLLVCYKANTWKDYKALANCENYTSAGLCDFFIKHILPNINRFPIPQVFKNQFKILELNEKFESTPHGFILKTATPLMPLVYDVDYAVLNASEINTDKEMCDVYLEGSKFSNMLEPPRNFLMETQKSNPMSSQFFVVPIGADLMPRDARPKAPKMLTKSNHALLSAVVSTDYELFRNTCIDLEIILQRFRKSRSNFQKNGRQTIILELKGLKQKVENMIALRDSIIDLMKKRF